MGAKRILFTWELGAHFGHLSRQLLVARELQQRGCELLFAARDTEVAATLLSPAGFAFVQAPVFVGRARLDRPPASYAELLLADGFADPEALLGRVRAWLRLFELYRPDAVVVDHSPTVLVATRAAGLRTTQIGSGFEIPPNVDPMPPFGIYKISQEDLQSSERRTVQNIDAVLNALGAASRRIGSLAELFETDGKIFATFAELDPYPSRENIEYTGPLVTRHRGVAHHWLTSKPKIFAYFHDGVPGTKAMVEAFRASEAETICVIPGLSSAAAVRISTPETRIYSQAVQLEPLLRSADLVVSNGSVGLSSQALLAGVPLLMLPSTVEQSMHARCVNERGAGIVLGLRRECEVFASTIGELLGNSVWKKNARAFAHEHAGFDLNKVVSNVANKVIAEPSDGVAEKCAASL